MPFQFHFVFRAYILSRHVMMVVDVVEGNIVKAAATGCLAMVDVDKHDRRHWRNFTTINYGDDFEFQQNKNANHAKAIAHVGQSFRFAFQRGLGQGTRLQTDLQK
jgi:hypothetical protein